MGAVRLGRLGDTPPAFWLQSCLGLRAYGQLRAAFLRCLARWTRASTLGRTACIVVSVERRPERTCCRKQQARKNGSGCHVWGEKWLEKEKRREREKKKGMMSACLALASRVRGVVGE